MSFKLNHTKFEIIVKTMAGMEEILADEMKFLGVKRIEPLKRAVKGVAGWKEVYALNLRCYFALRVLIPVHHDTIHNEEHLYNAVKRVNWTDFVDSNQTIAVSAAVNSQYFQHSHFVALKTKDAIVDQFVNRTGSRPDVDVDDADLRVNVHIFKNNLTVSLDTSGESLHKRGYRVHATVAPLNEVLAAGLVKLSGWNYKKPLLDPMCGSGTIVVEAAFQALRMPPQDIYRSFSFKRWKNFDVITWEKVVQEAISNQLDSTIEIFGSDADPKAIEFAKGNTEVAELDKRIQFNIKNFHDYKNMGDMFLIFNPPYDKRIQDDAIIESYKEIGNTLKQHFINSEAWIFSGNLQALKFVGLRPSKKINMFNGPIESKFQRYEMYKGSKKAKYNS